MSSDRTTRSSTKRRTAADENDGGEGSTITSTTVAEEKRQVKAVKTAKHSSATRKIGEENSENVTEIGKAKKPAPANKKGKLDTVQNAPGSASLLPANMRIAEKTSGRWLMKSEPETFSFGDLLAKTEPEGWDGVRNYVARNHLASMKVGDQAFFYHSNCKPAGIVGIMEVVQGPSIDETQFDKKGKYYDEKATTSAPRWVLVHVRGKRWLKRPVELPELRSHANPSGDLKDMMLLKQSRLSVSPVTEAEWDFILSLERNESIPE